MPKMPNPFEFAGSCPADTAAASPSTSQVDAAAEPSRFVLDEQAFLNDIEPLPAFLGAPSQEYLCATDLMPVLEVLAGRP